MEKLLVVTCTRWKGVSAAFLPLNPQVASVLLRIKRVMASVKLILILRPSGAVESEKNLSLPEVKNLTCGFWSSPNPQLETRLSRIKRVMSGLSCGKKLYFPGSFFQGLFSLWTDSFAERVLRILSWRRHSG